ncbi:MAG: hypothetical protein VKQ33_01600 [Candidatus Sericytochromatia bacterium]|nr:hypothetical protein [Candidatus Sericytochromatia bacterium]
MNVSHLRDLGVAVLTRLGAPMAAAAAPATGSVPTPTMAAERWGTVVAVTPSQVGDRFTLGRLRFRADDGTERTFAVERGHTLLSFNWLDDRGAWQRRRALLAELRPGMRAEVWGEAGVAEAVLVEGRPRAQGA